MIVRINQLDPARADPDSGWPAAGLLGPIRPGAPPRTSDLPPVRAFELLILGQDEQNRPLTEAFRQSQLRQMIPPALGALREPGEEVVVRLDGSVADGELLAAFRWLTDPDGRGRFAVSGMRKLEDAPGTPLGSIRMHPTGPRLGALCTDPAVGLERSVRLRAFCVPESLVNPVLELANPDDERWDEVLDRAGLIVATTRGLRSLQIYTRRFDAAAVKSRIMQRLVALASGQGVPA